MRRLTEKKFNCRIVHCRGDLNLQISVRFFTNLREITGKKKEILDFPPGEVLTVDEVLKELAEDYGKDFVEYVYDGKTGETQSFLQFLLNGRSLLIPDGLHTALKDGDVLAIIPPVGGG